MSIHRDNDEGGSPPAEEDRYARRIERRAEDLGLPTDPEAYQDGGMARVTSFWDLGEAETLVAILRSEDIPAWVNAPLATLNILGPGGFVVLVPAGRLDDALKAVEEARLAHQATSDESAEQEDVDADEEAAGAAPDEIAGEEPEGQDVRVATDRPGEQAAEDRGTFPLLIRIVYVVAILVAILVLYSLLIP